MANGNNKLNSSLRGCVVLVRLFDRRAQFYDVFSSIFPVIIVDAPNPAHVVAGYSISFAYGHIALRSMHCVFRVVVRAPLVVAPKPMPKFEQQEEK